MNAFETYEIYKFNIPVKKRINIIIKLFFLINLIKPFSVEDKDTTILYPSNGQIGSKLNKVNIKLMVII